MTLENYVLVTGASSKLGTLICEVLAKRKFNLMLHYYKSSIATKLLAKNLSLKFNKQKFLPIYADLSLDYKPEDISNLIYSKSISIIGIVNNASIYNLETSENIIGEYLEKNINIHFKNPVSLITIISKKLLSEDMEGFAINITDKNFDRSNMFSYSLSKKLLSDFTNNPKNNYMKNMKMIEFKPGNLLPSNNPKKAKEAFKHNFDKLLQYQDGYFWG
jgi:short-subunit dehydrogenase